VLDPVLSVLYYFQYPQHFWHTGSMSQTRSAYPPDVEALMPAARDLAMDLGSIPSRNRLMRELKIGAPKATEVRDALVGEAIGDDLDPDLDEHPNGSAGHPVRPGPRWPKSQTRDRPPPVGPARGGWSAWSPQPSSRSGPAGSVSAS
jgi:hypothetical protein